MKYRACEICGKTDVETFVFGSALGPISFNYCRVCAAMSAEPKGLEEFAGDYITYNSLKDSYMFDGDVREIVLKTGEKFKTRKEYLDFQKPKIKGVEYAEWTPNVGTDRGFMKEEKREWAPNAGIGHTNCGFIQTGNMIDAVYPALEDPFQDSKKEESKFIWTDSMKNCQLSNEETE